LEETVKETQAALKLLTISFDEGDISFTGVFIMQGELARNQDQLAQAQGDIATSLISLYKALGGGWEIRCSGFETHGVMAQPPEPLEVVPTPEATPPLPAPHDDEPPSPVEGALRGFFTDEED
jgi:hypothetical protein